MARRSGILLVLLALALAGCAAPAADAPARPEPAAPQDETPRNLFLLDAPRPFNLKVSNGDEPMILASRDGEAIYIGDTSGMYVSLDGGATFTRAPDPFLRGLFQDGWALAEDDAGTLYAADTQGQVIGVAASTDHGASWSVTSSVVEIGTIADRPWLAARGDGEVLLLQNGDRGETCTRSRDGGQTFLDRSGITVAQPNAGNAAFDSRGNVWFSNGARLYRWGASCLAAPNTFHMPASGAQIFTQVAIDAQDRVYWADPTPDNGAMRLTVHSPGMATPRSLVVSPPALKSNTFAAISAGPGDEIAVAWYGSETAGNPSAAFSGAWNVYVARVTGFHTATPEVDIVRLTTEPNHVGGFCMGGVSCGTPVSGGSADRDLLDYFGIDHGPDGTLHVAYGHDGNTANGEVRYARLAPLQ